LARLNALVRDVTATLDDYDIYEPAKAIERFVDDLSNWYVRRNRRRFWKAEQDADKQAAFATLHTCLATLARLLAPFTPYVAESLYQNLVASQDPSAPQSVHLASWPEAIAALIDDELLEATALLMETVGLGRSARKAANLRVRQPLSELLVRAPGGAERLGRFVDELRDELNVKQVRFLEVGDGLVVQRFKPNLPVVGRKYGKLVPAIRQELEGLTGAEANAAAEQVKAGGTFELRLESQVLTLGAEDVLIEASSPPGYAVAEGNGLLVALNTTLTPALVLEGQARDLVRFIQDARKAAGLDISDRIEVTCRPGPRVDLDALLREYGDVVAAETLATSVRVAEPEPDAHVSEAELGDSVVAIGLKRSRAAAAAGAGRS
jgi:isoleucyl-tRNA synthetase